MQQNVQLKICGITNTGDRDMVIAAGADFMGSIIDVPSSPRSVTLTEAAFLFNTRDIPRVAVMVNPLEPYLLKVIDRLSPDAVQLHGDESPEFINTMKEQKNINVWKVVHIPGNASDKKAVVETLKKKISEYSDAGVTTFLLDTSVKTKEGTRRGGTGATFDWNILDNLSLNSEVRVFVAGGVTPRNLGKLLSITTISGVDVNSGVELYPGKKDPKRVRQLIKEYQRAVLRQSKPV